MIEMMNTNGFNGAIYRTEYAMICQPMTRMDTPITQNFLVPLAFPLQIKARKIILQWVCPYVS